MKKTKRAPLCMAVCLIASELCILSSASASPNYEVGLVGISQTGYLAEGEMPVLAVPFFGISLGNFTIDPTSITYNKPLNLQRQLSAKVSYGSPVANNAQQDKTGHILTEFGVIETSPIGDFSVTLSTDVNGTQYGYRLGANYDKSIIISRMDSMLTYSASISFLPASTVDYMYGIEKPNKYNLTTKKLTNSGLVYNAGLMFFRQLTRKQFLFTGASIEAYTGGITDSALVNKTIGNTALNTSVTLGYGARF